MPPSPTQKNTEKASTRGRVAKRSCNACARCRTQKIKCSGSQPCEACKKRKLTCRFDLHDQKILVTRGYILDLQRQIANRQASGTADYISPETLDASQDETTARATEDGGSLLSEPLNPTVEGSSNQAADADGDSYVEDDSMIAPGVTSQEEEQESPRRPSTEDPLASTLTNPLSSGAAPSMFMTASNGRSYYLGTSSNWPFSRRVLSLAHEHVRQSPIASDMLLFDEAAYDLDWDGSRVTVGPETPLLPSLDHAIYLVNAVKFHCTQISHMFDEESFMKSMYDFYADPTPKMAAADLSYIHLLIIFAFGKALVERNGRSKRPPGSEFFIKALQLLPSTHTLSKSSVLGTEVLCCIALYFQSIDFRSSAYNYIGQAMRQALAYGMHTNMPVEHLGERLVERCRRIWWTVYVMDREMTSLMGLPQSMNDDDVHLQLPTFAGSIHRTSALAMQIRLSQTVANINKQVYGADGRLNKKFLASTKQVLGNIAGLADELRQTFPLQSDRNSINGVPRISAHLHLLYHQCIVLATRPLLLCFLKIQFESPESYSNILNSSKTIWNLIKICMESSQQMINILTCLQNQGLLETFLPPDLESLVVSTINLILGPILDPRLLENPYYWLEKAYYIFGEIVRRGNLIADFRRSELRQLEDILSSLPRNYTHQHQATGATEQQDRTDNLSLGVVQGDVGMAYHRSSANPFLSPGTEIPEDFDLLDTGMTTAQIMDMANSIANSDTEWLQHTIMEHSIW